MDINGTKNLLTTGLNALVPGMGTAANVAIDIVDLLASPSDYKPVKYNENFKHGGPINPYTKKVSQLQGKANKVAGANFRQNIMDPHTGAALNKNLVDIYKEKAYWNDLKNTRDKANNARQQREQLESIISPFIGMANYLQNSFNKGGTIDKQLSSGDVEIQGKPGIDTNKRNVLGNDVNLSKGETVSLQGDSAEVFSNAKDMLHPLTEKTFAETVKPIQKSTGKAEKKLKKFPKDEISANTIRFNKDILEVNKALQEQEQAKIMVNQVEQAVNSLNRYYGGKVKSNYQDGGTVPLLPTKSPYFMFNRVNPFEEIPGGQLPTEVKSLNAGPQSIQEFSNRYSAGTKPPQSPTQSSTPDVPNTVGDWIYAGAKTFETLGRVAKAFDAPEQFATDRYNIDRRKLSAQDQLDANMRSYKGALETSRTGSASTDRAMANSLFAQKIQADNTARRDLQNRQVAADLDVDRYNAQQKAIVDQINSQTQGLANQTVDAALTSIGTLGNVYMDMYNTKAENRITLATLNSLSRYYRVDVKNLIDIMKNNPGHFDNMLTRFNSTQSQ